MYHPYCHNPSALTEYLKQKLRLQRAKRLGHSLPAQVEQSVQLERNRKATTKSLCALCMKLLLKILSERARAVTVWVIRGGEGVGDIPGVRGGSGES